MQNKKTKINWGKLKKTARFHSAFYKNKLFKNQYFYGKIIPYIYKQVNQTKIAKFIFHHPYPFFTVFHPFLLAIFPLFTILNPFCTNFTKN